MADNKKDEKKNKIKMCKVDDADFTTACQLADTPATHRQYRKWLQGRGKAYAMRSDARTVLAA